MKLSLYAISVETFAPMLRMLMQILDKGAEQSKTKGRDPETLLAARLAPDMYPLGVQIQIACGHAADAVARLTGKEPVKAENNEKTLADFRERIAAALAVLDSADPAQFEGAEHRKIVFDLIENLALEVDGLQYVRDWALPNFYFHIVTAYDILRHEGVEIGKREFLPHVAAYIRPKAAS